jgi:hypothetical protein
MIQVENLEKAKSGDTKLSMSKFFIVDLAGTEKTLGVKGRQGI